MIDNLAGPRATRGDGALGADGVDQPVDAEGDQGEDQEQDNDDDGDDIVLLHGCCDVTNDLDKELI